MSGGPLEEVSPGVQTILNSRMKLFVRLGQVAPSNCFGENVQVMRQSSPNLMKRRGDGCKKGMGEGVGHALLLHRPALCVNAFVFARVYRSV